MSTHTLKTAKHQKSAQSVESILQVVTTNKVYSKICRDSLKRVRVGRHKRLDILPFDDWQHVQLAKPSEKAEVETVFISRLGDIPERIPEQAQAGSTGKHLLFLEDLPVEAITSRIVRLGVRTAKRLHIARENTPSTIAGLLFRVVSGIVQDGPKRIADAWIEDGQLVLLAPSFARLSVPTTKLEEFIGNNPAEVVDFEIDEDGSFLYWPHADVHLGWEQLLAMVDPAAMLHAQDRTRDFNRRYGAAIRSFREESGLRQGGIKGLTERNLRRVEKGGIMASRNTLEALAAAHRLTVADYMKKLATRL